VRGKAVRRYEGTKVRWATRSPFVANRRVQAAPPYPRTFVPSYLRTPPLSHCRKGAVLLEAIVALVILAVAGTAAVTMVSQSADSVRRARMADAEMREAGAFFHSVALWTREDLDRRLGERGQGKWKLIVQRPTPTLYEVVLTDSAVTQEILRTTLFRPEPPEPELSLPSEGADDVATAPPPPGAVP
jgi:type II secretory pathway pseudopilin PulG